MKIAIIVFACVILFNGVTSLKCHVCSSTDRSCVVGSVSESTLQTCEPSELHCVTHEVTATTTNGSVVVNIELSCQAVAVTGCTEIPGSGPIAKAKSCFSSCTTDGCNRLSATTPTPAATTSSINTTEAQDYSTEVTEMREIETTKLQETTTPKSEVDSEPEKRKGLIPEVKVDKETTTAKSMMTTSDAQSVGVSTNLIFNLFASALSAILLSNLHRD